MSTADKNGGGGAPVPGHSYALTITELHSRVSVLEQQQIDSKDATRVALAAVEKATLAAATVAEKAVAKFELTAAKTDLEASISSLRQAFDQQIKFQKELTDQLLNAQDKAVTKAEVAAEKRFESVNEFRSTLADQQRDLATKTEVNLRFQALEGRINTLADDAKESKGRGMGLNAGWGYLVGAIGVCAAVLTVIILAMRGHS